MGSIPQLSILKGKQSPLYARLLHRIFEERVDKTFGEKVAMIYRDENDKEQRTNYNTLNSSANRIASALLNVIKSKNLQPNSDGDWIIAVCMKPTDNLVTSLLAIWKCGGKHDFMKRYLRTVLCNVISSDSCIFTVGRDFPSKPHQPHFERIQTSFGNYALQHTMIHADH